MSFTLLGILNSQAAGAGGAGAYDLLETTVLTSSASSVSFTGLGAYSDYKHLQIRATHKTTGGTDGSTFFIVRANSDSGNNYAQHKLEGDGSTVSSEGFASQNGIYVTGTSPRAGETNIFGASILDVLDFSSTSKNTTFRFLAGSVPSNQEEINLTSGLYANTAAVTSIEFTVSGDAATGSRFSLYGIK